MLKDIGRGAKMSGMIPNELPTDALLLQEEYRTMRGCPPLATSLRDFRDEVEELVASGTVTWKDLGFIPEDLEYITVRES